MKTITKQECLQRLGLTSYYQLAQRLGITQQAISQWPEGVVPVRTYAERLHCRWPGLFPMPTEGAP